MPIARDDEEVLDVRHSTNQEPLLEAIRLPPAPDIRGRDRRIPDDRRDEDAPACRQREGLQQPIDLVIRDAVLQGAGIAVLPSFYVGEELRSGRIVEVLGEYTSPLALVHAVHPRAKSAAVRVRPIVEHLASCFATAKWATR